MRRSVTLLYLFLILFSFLPFFLERSKRITILQNISGWFILPYRVIANDINDYLKMKEENEDLKRKLTLANTEISRLKFYKLENMELKKILQFTIDKKIFVEPLQVITYYEEGGNRIYLCQRKTYNIILENLPVIGYDGLIGKTKSISKDFITVQSIRHSNSFVSVMNLRTGVHGILRWNGEFIIDGVSINEDFEVGDTIITSGMGGIYPKGINVGIVKQVKRSMKEYEAKIYVRTFEEIKFYDQVFVILKQ